MKRTGVTTRSWLATLALTTLIWVAPGRAQSPSTTPQNPSTTPQSNDDLVRWQLANFDQFLDNHPEVSDQLRKNPALVDDKQFVANHPALQQYLAQHPEIRSDIEQNPRAVMHQEQQYERTEDRDRNGITRTEVAAMDHFLDQHPEIAEQLRKNPKLIDDSKWVGNHPELQQYMAEHPTMRREFDEHPDAFMRDENRFDHQTDRPDITRGELARMDQFLDKHPEIAEQLKKDPKLIDDQKWVANHPELQKFMKEHPEVRQQFDEHPYAFMRDENRYDRWEDRRDEDTGRGQLSSFHNFLEGHSTIAADISKNPTLATNDEYLQNHTELQAYLQANPEVKEQLNQNPQSFIKSAQATTGTTTPGTAPKTTTMPKTPGSDPK
jgi:dsDNA-binding SOS-regulon protein